MRTITVAVLAAVAVACGRGAEGDDMGMFGNPNVIVGASATVNAGTRKQLFQAQVPEGESEPILLTLIPPSKQNTDGFNGFEIEPMIDLYAVIKWGNGQGAQAQAEVDVAQGLSFPIRGSFVSVEIVNENSARNAFNVGAFLSRGTTANGVPQRTKVVQRGGVPVSGANPIPALGGSDLMRIPPYAQSLTAQVMPSIVSGPPPEATQFTIEFVDITPALIGGAPWSDLRGGPIDIPSDAYNLTLTNWTSPPTDITSSRVVFTLSL
jgi:hypothetical protein